jgi:hypothetical protein
MAQLRPAVPLPGCAPGGRDGQPDRRADRLPGPGDTRTARGPAGVLVDPGPDEPAGGDRAADKAARIATGAKISRIGEPVSTRTRPAPPSVIRVRLGAAVRLEQGQRRPPCWRRSSTRPPCRTRSSTSGSAQHRRNILRRGRAVVSRPGPGERGPRTRLSCQSASPIRPRSRRCAGRSRHCPRRCSPGAA